MADETITGKLVVTEKIGIGIDEPIAQLHIASTEASRTFLESGGALLKVSIDSTSAAIGTDSGTGVPLALQTDGTNRLTITSSGNTTIMGPLAVQNTLTISGNVGIGVAASATAKLQVNGVVSATSFQGDASGLTGLQIPAGSVVNVQLADNAVTAAKIQDGSVGQAELAANSVVEAKIASSAVVESKLSNNAVTAQKIATGAVVTDKLANGAVTAAKLEDVSVSELKLSDGAVSTNKIAASAVNSEKLADSAVTTAKLAAGSVTLEKLDASARPAGSRWIDGLGGAIAYTGGNVGIGTPDPYTTLTLAGSIGFTSTTTPLMYIFPGGGNDPNVSGRQLFAHSLVWSEWGMYYRDPDDTLIFQQNNNTPVMAVGLGNQEVSIPTGQLSFGAQTRQMVNLWTWAYGIGVQPYTLYFRSDHNFCWFRGGTHSDVKDSPGGGTRLMALNEYGDLILSARTNPSGNPAGSLCRALVDFNNKLLINIDNDYRNGVDIVNGRFVSSIEYKENITNLSTSEALDTFKRLNPVKFKYKTEEPDVIHAGFIAEEVPALLTGADNKAIGPLDMIAVLTKVLQEQQSTITQLSERIRVLETNSQSIQIS